MKMRRLLSWLLVLALCFALTACQAPGSTTIPTSPTTADTTPTIGETTPTTPATQPEGVTPLLYRVTDEGGHVAWLFGSIHVGLASYYPLPAYVLDAFDGADALAVEADIIAFEKDLQQQVQAMSCLVYSDGTTIENYISPELYTTAVEILTKEDTYSPLLDLYCPAMWSSTIESLQYEKLGADISLGIDRHLLERAHAAEKKILEVESAEFQYQMLAGFSRELQELLLESAVMSYERPLMAKASLSVMMDLWASGDEQAFAAYLAEESQDLSPEEELLYQEYNQALLTERNLSMANYAEAALRSGEEVFICVGAAHVVGDGALAQLLAQRGYTVECITQ